MGTERFKSTLAKLRRTLSIDATKDCNSLYADRAKLLEERLDAAPPASWPGTPEEWVVYGHLTAAVAFYRYSCIEGWLLTPVGEEILRPEYQKIAGCVDALSWLLADFDNAMRRTPLAGALIKKMILEDHSPIGKPPSLRLDFCAIDFSSALIAKNHFDWVLDHSTDVAYCTLAREWMTRMLNDLTRWELRAGWILDGTAQPIPGVDAADWLDRFACGFPSEQRTSRHYYSF